mgnify:CR=1 FL=1
MSHVRVAGAWRSVANGYVKVNGSWRLVVASSVRTPSGWRPGILGRPPAVPVMEHTGYGKFTITNHDPLAVYTLTRVSGSGTASRSGAVVTLSDVNARFSIVASYAVGAPGSAAGFMERKAYTFTLVNRPYPCGTHQCNCRQEWGSCGCGGCGGFPTPNSQSWGQCGCPGDMCWYNPTTVCDTCTSYCDNWVNEKNPTPSGFVDKFGEWSRVT